MEEENIYTFICKIYISGKLYPWKFSQKWVHLLLPPSQIIHVFSMDLKIPHFLGKKKKKKKKEVWSKGGKTVVESLRDKGSRLPRYITHIAAESQSQS